MDKPKICFLTTVFPMEAEVVEQYFESLSKQSYTDFDLVIVNDGLVDLDSYVVKYTDLNVVVMDAEGRTPVENRRLLIDFAYSNGYQIAIFGDSDDYFSASRVESSLKVLAQGCDILVNELHMFSAQSSTVTAVLEPHFERHQVITFEDLLDRNCMGLSNTAVNLSRVQLDSYFENALNLIALDWYLFSRALLDGARVQFTDEAVTFYRQYGENTANLIQVDKHSIERALNVKLQHYTKMKEYSDAYVARDKAVQESINNDVISSEYINKQIDKIILPPLWWEIPIIEDV
ncbi:glycosyltransferase family A protein [Pseudoalteromonas luteoviolacea]|uniref:Glycosyltransferase 2-like domain-containing protein n=1 Tax=Pseudoalteromonas luteoviolacea NCIMB 1942 TaxID=1365253 RepID=A0A166ZJF3_9GAMM|nr:glycosyltransferase family A protein [Pseudoalteromonas luteoviolacea]KZN44374.1 hypothetical protein N482_16535 [Pseudoalteromonas luteoviolacea NCIMB 1942]